MKWGLFIYLIFTLNFLEAQDLASIEIIELVGVPEIMPKWVHGTNKELMQEITSSIKHRDGQFMEGKTVLRFKVDTLGQVSEPKILRSISKEIDKQLLEIILNYEFEAGMTRNRKVDARLNLLIRIKPE